ncbi:MAG: nitrate reductase gamma subunit [Miltoncostaeaceae bacterium]|nr:nitrate reductase gamma subunit [Miltoncostaeaceae bacterium]
MGTGIVSVALSLDGRETLSRVLLGLAAAVWVVLAALLARRALRDRGRLRMDARGPSSLAGAAGTAVLGTRMAMLGWGWAGAALLVIAVALWAGLLIPVLTHLGAPTSGASLMVAVSTESLAALAATLAAQQQAGWLLDAALAPLVLGLVLYALVIVRFDRRQLTVGLGDHWITGGALAISALAAAEAALAAGTLGALGAIRSLLQNGSLVLWALAAAWLPVLLVGEAVRPRLRYDVRRWSTVFPVGMLAAAGFVVGRAADAPARTQFARVWLWAGLAVWLLVAGGSFGGGLRRLARTSRRAPR